MTWKKAQIIEILERYGPASCSGLEVELVCAGSRQGHRSRGRFRVKVDESGRVKVGLRGLNLEGEPVDIRGCPAQASLFRDTLARVADVLDQDPEAARQVVDIEIWTGEGEALVLVEVDREEALVTMRAPLATAALPKATTALGLRHEGETVMVHGEPVVPVHHRWGRQKVRVSAPPTSWTHANPAAAARLIDWVDRQVQGGRHRVALDLCCATGTLTLHLAHNFEKIFAVDEDHLAIAALREACVTAGIEGVEFRAGRASKVVRKLCRERARPTLAIINPMRRPLGRKELREIALLGVEEVLYLGPSAVSTAKDSVVLEELGFKPTKAAIINLHPGTSQTMLGMVWSR